MRCGCSHYWHCLEPPRARRAHFKGEPACLQEFAGLYGPAVLLLDDVHHFDAASWCLLAAIAGAAAGAVLIVAAMRPQSALPIGGAAAAPESVAACVRQCRQALLESPGATPIALEPFTQADTEHFMALALDEVALPSEKVSACSCLLNREGSTSDAKVTSRRSGDLQDSSAGMLRRPVHEGFVET